MDLKERLDNILCHYKRYTFAANELESLLKKNNISYIRREVYDGWQFLFPSLKMFGKSPDVVIHSFSYGHESGLFESYNFIKDKGDVHGCLNAVDVLKLIKHQMQCLPGNKGRKFVFRDDKNRFF